MGKRLFERKDVRDAVFSRTRGRCYYCGIFLHPDKGNPSDFHGRDWLLAQTRPKMSVDHCLPMERGGRDELSNLVACCSICNSKKGSSTLEEYRFRLGLTTGEMPFRFAGDQPQIVERDYLVVVSPDMIRGMIKHNFPKAYDHRSLEYRYPRWIR